MGFSLKIKCPIFPCDSVNALASFPGPTQLSVAYSTVMTKSWAGPGNELVTCIVSAQSIKEGLLVTALSDYFFI